MAGAFVVQGTTVELADLLALQWLSSDLARVHGLRTNAKKIGEQRSVFRGQGREFIEMKPYQAGDDVRQIDWRVTAKKQSPYVRVMEEDRHQVHAVWLNLTPSCYFGTQQCFKSVLACHWVAFIIWRLTALNTQVKLIISVGAHWEQTLLLRSKASASKAMSVLVSAHQHLAEHYKTLEPARSPKLSGQRPHSWWVGDFMAVSELPNYQALAAQSNTLTLLQTLDAFDEQLPNTVALPIKKQGKTHWFSPNHDQTRETHAQLMANNQKQLSTLAAQHSGQHFAHISHRFDWQDVTQWPLNPC